MRKFLLLSILFFMAHSPLFAQSKEETLRKAADAACDYFKNIDINKITDAKTAEAEMVKCFTTSNVLSLFVQLAQERGIALDKETGEKLGEEIAMEMFKNNCQPFIQLSMKLAEGETTNVEGLTSGSFMRIDQKDFAYIVIKEPSGKESSFLWFQYFKNAEQFQSPEKLKGKRIKISWVEKEVYMPKMSNYFKIKEIVSVEIP